MIQLRSAADMRRVSKEMAVLKGPKFKKVVDEMESAGNKGLFEAVLFLEGISDQDIEIFEKVLSDAGYLYSFAPLIKGSYKLHVHWYTAKDDEF